MQVNVIAFGQIKDITGNSEIILDNVADTDQLVQKLHSVYPTLANSKYAIAVDRKIINSNTELNNNNTIALLPPFSGG